jgi:hypothetical protein
MPTALRLKTLHLLVASFAATGAAAQDADLAQTLTNPIADLVSVPFQLNIDEGFGAEDGQRSILNIQPVLPFALNEDWNVISRTIIPVIWQDAVIPGSSQEGIGDVLQSLFLSPRVSGPNGLIWGAGLAFSLPTATEDALGTGKVSAGPTALALRMTGPWTYGALANHLWSVAGDDKRTDVNQTYMQPFLSYTTTSAITFTLSAEAAYDWEREAWSMPFNAVAAKLIDVGGRPVSLQAGVRYWAAAPDGGPDDFGLRVGATVLFPK